MVNKISMFKIKLLCYIQAIFLRYIDMIPADNFAAIHIFVNERLDINFYQKIKRNFRSLHYQKYNTFFFLSLTFKKIQFYPVLLVFNIKE